MFAYCNSLTSAAELPATTLTERCYESMFMNCTSLKTTQQIYAVTAAYKCCYAMFYGCTSLTAAPELPATTLMLNCYTTMFQGCSNLNYVKAMFTTNPNSNYYLNGWLTNVAETGTFVKNSAAAWSNTDAKIPTGWTVQTASPDK